MFCKNVYLVLNKETGQQEIIVEHSANSACCRFIEKYGNGKLVAIQLEIKNICEWG